MENENIQNEQEEIITVELGQEGEVKSVEEEIAAVTPEEEQAPEEVVEEPSEEPSEEPTTEPEEEIKEEDETDTTPSENPSPEKEEDEGEEKEDKSDDTPSEEKEGEESEEPAEEPSDAPADEDEASEVDEEPSVEPSVSPEEELERLNRELAELKEKEETRKMFEDIQTKAIEASNQFDDFADKLSHALEDTFKQYGIDTDKTIEEIKAIDPAKAAIAEELIGHAEAIRDAKIREFQAPIIEAQKNLVFREASKIMCDYEMSDAQAQEAANNLITIINQVGIADIGEDLKTKVEFAIARAKLTVKDDKQVIEEVEQKPEEEEVKVEEKPKEEQPTEEEEQVKEEQEEAPTEPPTEAPTEAPKADLEAFKEGAATGDVIVNNNDDVNVHNVLAKLAATPFKNQVDFYKKHAELIRQAGIIRYKKQGLK